MGAMMAEGRGREHLDLMLTREEWERVKASIRELPDAHDFLHVYSGRSCQLGCFFYQLMGGVAFTFVVFGIDH